MNVHDLADVAVVAVSLITVITALFALIRWVTRRQSELIIRQIREATYPLSPQANGGLSLADVARKTDEIAHCVSEMRGKVDLLVDLYSKEK